MSETPVEPRPAPAPHAPARASATMTALPPADEHKDFPVSLEKELGKPRKRFAGLLVTRDLSELPPQRPGTLLVFHNGSTWTVAHGRIKGSEDYVVEALSVSVVQSRMREIEVEVRIPSKDPADDFTVVAGFACQVTRPELIAEQGPFSVVKRLQTYLTKDAELLTKGMGYTVDEIHDVRYAVEARVRAYCAEVPPGIAGLEALLTTVQVLTPIDLKAHRERVRNAKWEREVTELLAKHEDQDVRRLAEIFRDPAAMAALGTVRDKVDLDKLIAGAYADRRTQDANLLEFLKILEKGGQLDSVPIDGRILIEHLIQRYGGATSPVKATATVGHESPAVLRADNGESIGHPDADRFTLDEND